MSSSADSDDDRLRVICGPTAAGKSALALRLAEAVGGTIISADSRQIYRGFDVGTAKPTADERRRVPHFGIDVIDPATRYSAADWAAAVPAWLAAARAHGRVPIVVGGTGFYLRALFEPLFDAPALPEAPRAALDGFLRPLPTADLQRWCRALDPARAHLGRAQLLRAIETVLLAGERISDLHRRHARAPALTPRYLLVDPGTALAGAITARVDRMLATGWLDEVRSLADTVSGTAAAWTATGYDVLRRVVQGGDDLAAAREVIIRETRRYAKRQRTWFRHQLGVADVQWLDPREPEAFARVMTWWTGED